MDGHCGGFDLLGFVVMNGWWFHVGEYGNDGFELFGWRKRQVIRL